MAAQRTVAPVIAGTELRTIQRQRKLLRCGLVALVASFGLVICLAIVVVVLASRFEPSIASKTVTALAVNVDHNASKTIAQELLPDQEDDKDDDSEDNEDDDGGDGSLQKCHIPKFHLKPVDPSDSFVHLPNNSTSRQFMEHTADAQEITDMIGLLKDGVEDFQILAGTTVQHIRISSFTVRKRSLGGSSVNSSILALNASTSGDNVTMDMLILCVDEPFGPTMDDCHIVAPSSDESEQRRLSGSTPQIVVPRRLQGGGQSVIKVVEIVIKVVKAHSEVVKVVREWLTAGCRRRRATGACSTRRRGVCARRRRAGECGSRRRRRRR